jgi:hypothetical protein
MKNQEFIAGSNGHYIEQVITRSGMGELEDIVRKTYTSRKSTLIFLKGAKAKAK